MKLEKRATLAKGAAFSQIRKMRNKLGVVLGARDTADRIPILGELVE